MSLLIKKKQKTKQKNKKKTVKNAGFYNFLEREKNWFGFFMQVQDTSL